MAFGRAGLKPTSALVMLWAEPLYKTGPALEFIDLLDLSSGLSLYQICNEICPWYGEVIRNRKYFIRDLIAKTVSEYDERCDIIIPAAGKTPLSLEILSGMDSHIGRIYEVDISGMEEKKAIYDEHFPDYTDKISCITADIISGEWMDRISCNINESTPVIIIFEGISYYISKSEFERIISHFSTGKRQNTIIIEYLIPCGYVAEDRRDIPGKIFSRIMQNSGNSHVQCYTGSVLGEMIKKAGGGSVSVYTMKDMEHYRTGENRYFYGPDSGWIECILGRV